jgi:acetate kinase
VRVLVVNAGSSSMKLRLLGPRDELLGEHDLDAPQAVIDDDELDAVIAGLEGVDAVGHRIVHGGERFRDPVRVDADVLAALRGLVDLAPLHQPKSLAALDAVSRALPGVPAVACFDTAFHATMPPAAATYALPAEWRTRWGLRRYGFHGLSHAYASRRAAERIGGGSLRMVSCHLGAGASLAAVRDGRSVDTTMGFTPLEGLVMATRSGSVDPGLVLWLLEHASISERDLAATLEHASGLQALAGTPDMREALRRRAAGDQAAELALEVYLHRLRGAIAAMAAALEGLDALIFTGGVGERSAPVREEACHGLEFLGVGLDVDANQRAAGDAEVTAEGAAARVLVIEAREDLEIAAQVRGVLAA